MARPASDCHIRVFQNGNGFCVTRSHAQSCDIIGRDDTFIFAIGSAVREAWRVSGGGVRAIIEVQEGGRWRRALILNPFPE